MKTKTLTKFTLIKHKNKTNMTQSTGKYYVYDIPARDDKLIQYINIKYSNSISDEKQKI